MVLARLPHARAQPVHTPASLSRGARASFSAMLVWGLVDGRVVRGATCSSVSAAAGWNPLGGTLNETGSGRDAARVDSAAELPGSLLAAVGWGHTVRAKAGRRVEARGLNSAGQVDPGAVAGKGYVEAWTTVAALDGMHVVQVAAGERHSLALCDDGSVFQWGDGAQSSNSSSDASQDGGGACGSAPEDQAGQPMPQKSTPSQGMAERGIACVMGPGNSAEDKVSHIAAGARHSLALTRTGAVLAWGCNLQVRFAGPRQGLPACSAQSIKHAVASDTFHAHFPQPCVPQDVLDQHCSPCRGSAPLTAVEQQWTWRAPHASRRWAASPLCNWRPAQHTASLSVRMARHMHGAAVWMAPLALGLLVV